MEIKKINENSKKERFEFLLTINGNIICQRYFRINGFNNQVLSSLELVEAIDECVKLINDDLKSKSNIYLSNTSPQVFNNKDEMEDWSSKHSDEIEVCSFAVNRTDEDVFIWNGSKYIKYDKYINRTDYIDDNDQDNIFKFSFLDSGKEVCSKIWDGNSYPKFVRNNVDLSNSKNKYQSTYISLFESLIVNMFNSGRTDLIPKIVSKICKACSMKKEDYTSIVTFGDREYNLSIPSLNYKNEKELEKKYKKKTEMYFKEINW